MLRINEHGTRADNIVRTMLLHSRGVSRAPQPTNFNALLEQSIKIAYQGFVASHHELKVTLHTDLDPSLGKVNLVPQSISRAYVNI